MPKMARARANLGFTLTELLLSVAIIGLITGMSLPLYQSFQTRNDLDITAEAIAGSLRRAAAYSRGSNDDSQWSVEIQSSAVTLFKGTSFAGRDTSYDEASTISSVITVSGLTEVQFAKLTGLPSTTGNITLTLDTNNSRTVSINAKGMVNY